MILKELGYSFCSFVAIRYLLSIYYVLGVLSALYEEFYLILRTCQKWGRERLGNLSKITQLVDGIVRSSIIQVNLTPKSALLAFVPVLTNRNLMWAINVSYMYNLNISDSDIF